MATYSHSKLETYRNCPHQYKLKYIDRIPDVEEGIEAFMGSRVHEVLQRLYRHVLKSHPVTLVAALDYYDATWDRNWHEAVRIVSREFTVADYRETGRRCIRDYWRRYEPFDQSTVVGIERRVLFDLDSERGIQLQGYIDRLDRAGDGTYEIHDYKTSSFLPDQAKADADPQLALYQLAVEEMWRDVRDVTLVWHYLAFDAELRSTRPRETLEQLKADTLSVIAQIEEEVEFRAIESGLCDWCGYPEHCPLRKHEISVAELPPNQFATDDGVALVNKYVELTEQKAQMVAHIESEIEQVKAALISYAEANDVEVIVGSDHRVRVKKEAGLSAPRKGTAERDLLEERLRELGRWDEVTCLDVRALVGMICDGTWDEKTCDALSEFLRRCETWRLTKSRLRTGGRSD